MKREIAEKWVTALRSGEYKQTVNVLYDGEGYCCLGVLCKALGFEFEKADNNTSKDSAHPAYYRVIGAEDERHVLPMTVVTMAEMHSPSGEFTRDESTDELTALNDHGHDFASIADEIEAYWETL